MHQNLKHSKTFIFLRKEKTPQIPQNKKFKATTHTPSSPTPDHDELSSMRTGN